MDLSERIELVLSIISLSKDCEELNETFFKQGLTTGVYADRRKFLDLVQNVWRNNKTHIEKEGCFPLPGARVSSGGIDYFIHGLPHDSPLVSIPEEFKQLVNQRLKGYEIICEDGFCEWVEGASIFWEVEHFNLNKISPQKLLKGVLSLLWYKARRRGSKDEAVKRAGELRNLEDLLGVRAILFPRYLPEPLGMNSFLYLANVGTIDNPQGELPFVVRRYVYEAKTAINYAKSRGIGELHIIVGCRHEHPLEYLIRNERSLEKYK